ncbi:MAG: nucleoside deaminase [Defluviitaleaceae bacterium]|nr:nucleoside deaminase [Defluviitaleaceae bacterium]
MDGPEGIIFMREAYAEALVAYRNGETPVGCVIERRGEIIARAANARAAKKNALYHAELIALNAACEYVGDWRLDECAMYVTVEPCPMCAGAIIQSRLPFVAYGAKNAKAGCAGSVLDLFAVPGFNHQPIVARGLMEAECGELMSMFFKGLRER